MEEHDKSNPVAGVDALVDPNPLTIARVALLSRVNCPVLYGHADDMTRNIEAVYLAYAPIQEAAKSAKGGKSLEDALAWAENGMKAPDEYTKMVSGLLDSLAAFWNMLPSQSPEKKTPSTTETDGSRSSSSGGAERTGGASNT